MRVDNVPVAIGALKGRGQFAVRDDALGYSRSRGIFADWSEPALRAYVDHGLVANAEGFELSWTPEWEAKIKSGKWTEFPGYGRAKRGHIALQDHGNQIWFRNIKILEL